MTSSQVGDLGQIRRAVIGRTRTKTPISRLIINPLSYVDPKSVVVYGCSGGGDLALEVATMTEVTALAAEEPAAVHFTSITDKPFPGAAHASHRTIPHQSWRIQGATTP